MRLNRALVALGLALVLGVGVSLAVEAEEVKKPDICIDKELCAIKLRYGVEAFNRGRYSEAKAFFRQAVMADPTSNKAWERYDLSIMFDVAEYVKVTRHMYRTVTPTAPAVSGPGSAAPAPSAPTAPAPAPTPAGIPPIAEDEGC